MVSKQKVVLIINHNADIIYTLSELLKREGFKTECFVMPAISESTNPIIKFVNEYKPEVIIYDVAPPYDANYNFFLKLKQKKELQDIKIVLTTTNKTMLQKIVGKVEVNEIVGKPFDIEEIVKAIIKN